jgi:ribosomal protein RSM22 (predicted rRNA methylase)
MVEGNWSVVMDTELWKKIEQEVEGISLKELVLHQKQLSEKYRRQEVAAHYMTSRLDRLAYLLFRFPATYAVIEKLAQDLTSYPIKRVLDMGAGSGAGSLALSAVLSLEEIFLLDQDKELLAYAHQFLESSHQLICKNFAQVNDLPPVDLTLFSYSLGESLVWREILEKVLQTTSYLLIVEPGTPKGFARLKEVRTFLLEKGLFLHAPCPHQQECPLQEGNWCHFYARVQRRALQKEIKQGTLGYEDEKFSYLFFSKEPPEQKEVSRILRKPIVLPLKISATVCSYTGQEEEWTLSKRDPRFKEAKKWRWGDLIKS